MSSRSLLFFTALSVISSVSEARAQLRAYGGRENDNNCKTVYLVNPSDTIYYIAGMKHADLDECQTFAGSASTAGMRFRINVSGNEENHLLLLPRDTIAYRILMTAEYNHKPKELSLIVRSSPAVIPTNDDKKRNRQIGRLPAYRVILQITE